jgi:hypothetical protein
MKGADMHAIGLRIEEMEKCLQDVRETAQTDSQLPHLLRLITWLGWLLRRERAMFRAGVQYRSLYDEAMALLTAAPDGTIEQACRAYRPIELLDGIDRLKDFNARRATRKDDSAQDRATWEELARWFVMGRDDASGFLHAAEYVWLPKLLSVVEEITRIKAEVARVDDEARPISSLLIPINGFRREEHSLLSDREHAWWWADRMYCPEHLVRDRETKGVQAHLLHCGDCRSFLKILESLSQAAQP